MIITGSYLLFPDGKLIERGKNIPYVKPPNETLVYDRPFKRVYVLKQNSYWCIANKDQIQRMKLALYLMGIEEDINDK